jgi:hypothetical protein
MKRPSKPKPWPFKSLTLEYVIEDFIDDRPGPEKGWDWTLRQYPLSSLTELWALKLLGQRGHGDILSCRGEVNRKLRAVVHEVLDEEGLRENLREGLRTLHATQEHEEEKSTVGSTKPARKTAKRTAKKSTKRVARKS